MSGKGGKRKAEDEVEVVEGEAAPAAGGKKAKKDKAPPKPKAPVKLKPFTAEEERVAKGASMERNAAIATFLDGVREAYKQGAEYMKAAAAKKAVDSVRAHPVPIRVAQELLSLQGCGKGTVDKVAAFLSTYGAPAEGLAAEAAAAQAEAGRDPELAWTEASERDVLIDLLKNKQLDFAKVQAWRPDIKEGDF